MENGCILRDGAGVSLTKQANPRLPLTSGRENPAIKLPVLVRTKTHMKKLTLLCTALFAFAVSGQAADIVETAQSTGTFKTLVAALKAADKASMLKEDGPYTVFAPTDEAFAKLPKGTVESLLKPENKEKLGSILAYHVMEGKVMAADVKTMKAPTANGADLNVKVNNGKVMVNDAKVVKADVKASNGVIHVIDKVLMPPKA
jgi:uncharacterized surface protein with fasciclin (FAS1) repeats